MPSVPGKHNVTKKRQTKIGQGADCVDSTRGEVMRVRFVGPGRWGVLRFDGFTTPEFEEAAAGGGAATGAAAPPAEVAAGGCALTGAGA